MNAQEVHDLLVRFAIWISPTWEEDNTDDEDSARLAVSQFLRENGLIR